MTNNILQDPFVQDQSEDKQDETKQRLRRSPHDKPENEGKEKDDGHPRIETHHPTFERVIWQTNDDVCPHTTIARRYDG